MARRQSVLSLSAYATKIGRSLVPAELHYVCRVRPPSLFGLRNATLPFGENGGWPCRNLRAKSDAKEYVERNGYAVGGRGIA
jgi:hypothetical protein